MLLTTKQATILLQKPRHRLVAAGRQGPPGQPGPAGGEWLTGTGAPDNALGQDGQIYNRTATGEVFKKVNGVWVYQFTITAPLDYENGDFDTDLLALYILASN